MEVQIERRRGERRKGSWLYRLIAALFVLYLLTAFVPLLHLPHVVHIGLLLLMLALCLLDRRRMTLKHLAIVLLVCTLACGSMAYLDWGREMAKVWAISTAFLLMLSIVVFNVKMEPRVR